ncbi:hypothetical protein BGZ99_006606 [Dissophora globulifera]|uniref:Uncharacterized protein n=1 Tax=Dissophora globulifera TaxID=979702 RepID=A0A9P6US66_9FUNG|nr:hypothetical protein BGZ99_006606 [Dissophora globulifera]
MRPSTSSLIPLTPIASSTAPQSVLASNVCVDLELDLHLLHILANHLNGAYRSFSTPYSSRMGQPQKLVFASGAVSTASALGHVFGRPLQAKETIPCTPLNCGQPQTDLQHSLIQQAQSPSHTFQQQCSAHKRFRLFRQRPRKCPVHSISSSPNYILPPTMVHPLVVRPDKILLDHRDDSAHMSSWRSTLTASTSASSRLSSYSTLSVSSCTYGSDGESFYGHALQSSKKKKKKQSKKEKEQNQQYQQQLRCLCYLDTSLDQHHNPQQPAVYSQPLSSSSWYPQNHQKGPNRLRRIWNDSTIFHWSKPPASGRRSQQQQQQEQQQQHLPQQPYFRQERTKEEDSQQDRAEPIFNSRLHVNDGMAGVPMRTSLSGTDISDEGNHSLTDAEDQDGDSESSSANGSHLQVSYHDHYRLRTRAPRPGDDLKAISRHQAELSQQPGPSDYSNYRRDDIPLHQESRAPFASTFDQDDDDEDDDDEDWDIQSDSGAPSSSPMYSAEAREPTSFSTVTLPLSPPTKGYLKKPSNANLNSLRGRQRCLSLPVDTLPQGFLKMSSTPSEIWDEDFDIDSAEINVPSKVVESQLSLQVDIHNIKDFALHIEELKTVRASLRTASSSLKATNPTKHKDLSMLFQRDWEQAEVIIDLGEIAQTSTSTGSVIAAGPLSLLSGKGSQLSIGKSTTQKPRRPALSTTGPASQSSAPSTLTAASPSTSNPKSPSLSRSSTMTGATLVTPTGEAETKLPSPLSSRSSSASAGDSEFSKASLSMGQTEKRRPHLGSGIPPLQQASMMKGSHSSPAYLGQCTTPVTPLPNSLQAVENGDGSDSMAYRDGPCEYESNTKWQSSARGGSPLTHMGASKGASTSNGSGTRGAQADIDASLLSYQKYSQNSKRTSSRYHTPEHNDIEDDDEDDDGYESYGYSDGSSVGVITPIPSDRHMQVLKDILMEGLGPNRARQYMFKHGEQDHVRFSVEVIPGLLDHLKVLQERLGDQLMQLQQFTVIV